MMELPTPPVDPATDCFPHCLVWSPLPFLTWLVPFIGHMGIGDTKGLLCDFAGPYHIGHRKLAFGPPTRYVQLHIPPGKLGAFDGAVAEANTCYSGRVHNLCFDNCHSHCARALNTFGYGGSRRWNMVLLCFWMFFAGRWVSPWAVVKTWGPFGVVLAIVLVVGYK